MDVDMEPYKKFCAAMLRQAFNDINSGKNDLIEPAKRWLLEDEFAKECCELLGLKHKTVLQKFGLP